MVCTQCGAYSETNTKYCTVCGAPLPVSGPEQQAGYDSGAQPSAEQNSWSFVRAPKWPKPSFDLDQVDKQPAVEPTKAPAQAPGDTQRPTFASARREPQSAGFVGRDESSFEPKPMGTPPAPHNATPFGSVGGYEEQTPAYQGSFGRAPQRSTHYEEDEGVLSGPYQMSEEEYAERQEPTYEDTSYSSEGYSRGASFSSRPVYSRSADYEDEAYEDDDIPDMPASRRSTAPVTPQTRRSAAPYAAQGRNPGRSAPAGRKPAPTKRARAKNSSLRGGKRNTLIFAGAAGVLVVLLIVFGVIAINKNYGSIGGFFSSVFGGSPITKPAEVTTGVNKDGLDCWVITVYAKKGNTVTLRVDGEEISGEFGDNGFRTLNIPKNRFLPETPWEGPTAELTPDIVITTPDEEIVPLEIDPITVDVPALNLSVASPVGNPAYVNRSRVPISGTVDDGEVNVTVEGQPLEVDETGNFTGEYTLPDKGVHSLTIEAKKNGYQITRTTVQVDYTVTEAEIDLDKATLRTDKNADKTTVKGTITAGASMQLSAPAGVTVDTPTVDSGTGAFSFNAQIDSEGSYEIGVTLTKDGASTNGTIIVERAPDVDTYSRACQAMDYSLMTSSPGHSAKYLCVGTVAEVLETAPYTFARLTTDAGDVIFEYHGTAASIEPGDGKTYNVYGDYKGIHEETGLPLVYAWFIIKPSR